MYIGNSSFFKPCTPYHDKNGRLHMKPPDWGEDIYMWWSTKEHICADGTLRHYKYFNFSVGGKREQYYCRPGEHYPQKFIDLHSMDFCLNFFFFLGSQEALARFAYKPKKTKTKRKNGRPKAFSSEIYDLLEVSGFGTNGSKIVIKYKKYLTKEATVFRFNLLSDENKAVIGDAETLLALSKQAYSLLKSRNSKSIKTSYEECFRDNVLQKTSSLDIPSVERLHEALVAA